MKDKWMSRYMQLAQLVAEWSHDPSTKVGAVVVGKDRREIALGYNGFPAGIADTPERLADREVKYRLMQHAERNAIDNSKFDLTGATLVVTLHPCVECSKSIVSKGVARVACPGVPVGDRWRQQALWGAEILSEAGVKILYTDE
jgi:dCMP deaminase